eukprot:COSAG06_NODE_1838_length_8251_cov_28.537291_6_plen_430_part_01
MSARSMIVALVVAAVVGAALMEHGRMSTQLLEMSHEHGRMSTQLLEMEHSHGRMSTQLLEMSHDLQRSNDKTEAARRELTDAKSSQDMLRNELADVRRSAEEEAASTRTELLDVHRRLAATGATTTGPADPAGTPSGGSKRALQDDVGGGDAEICLDPNSVAVVALDMAHGANEELVRLYPVIGSKANATDLEDVRSRLEDFAAALSTATGQPVAPEETLACMCSICAEPLEGGGLCEPWQESSECECSAADAPEGAPVRQSFPVTQSDPECCRAEYLETVTVTQMRVQSEYDPTVYNEVYDQDEVIIKIDGQVTFSFSGFENVEQTDSSWQAIEGGIRSGVPADGGTFQHTFDTPGEYFFNSYVHTTLRLKVTVMDCVFCNVIQGYDGAEPDSLAHALSSRVPGNYALHVDNFASHGVITYLTVFAGQI